MADWVLASWWAGGVLALGALVLMALALFRDRSRGRRRCPACWYDMSGIAGLRCPECGRTQRGEKRFFRTRRRWRGVALGGVILFAAAGTAVAPAVYTGKWAKHTPVLVLRVVLSCFKADAKAVDQRLSRAGAIGTLTTWERLLLASDMGRDVRWWLDASPEQQFMVREAETRYSSSARVAGPPRPSGRRTIGELSSHVGGLKEECRPMLPELLEALGSGDRDVSAFAANALAQLGPSAASETPAIRRAFVEGKGRSGRESSLRLLLAFQAKDRRTKRAIQNAALGDPDISIRESAAMALAVTETGDRTTMDALLGVLTEGTSEYRQYVVRTLGWYAHSETGTPPQLVERGGLIWARVPTPSKPTPPDVEDERVLGAIAGALSDADPMVRIEAASMLGGIGARVSRVAPRLRERILVEKDSTARRGMIGAYVRAEAADVEFLLPELMELIRGEDEDARRWAAWKLAWCGRRAESAIPVLREAALEDQEGREGVYCQALGFIGGEGWRVLDELVRSGNPVRSVAARSLGMAGTKHPEAAAYLLAAMKEPDVELRAAAALGLHFCDGNRAVIEALSEMVRRDEHWIARRTALIALGGVGDIDTIVGVCSDAMRDPEQRVRDLAALTLRERVQDSDAARAALAKAAADGDEQVRKAAQQALEKPEGEEGP